MPTPNMGLTLPTPTVTVGPTYASQNNTAFTSIDSHDHTSGKGAQIPTAGLLINADLTFGGFNATNFRSLRLASQGAALSLGTDIGCLYMVGNDLWWNSGTGQQVQVTIGANLASTALTTLGDTFYGGISGAPTRLPGNTTTSKKYLSQTGTGSVSAAPAWSIPSFADLTGFVQPTVQRLTATGSTAGYLFTVTTSSTCNVGDTYTNNSQTFTVQAALSAQSGQVLWCTGTGAPAGSGTLTRATGVGTASITFTSFVAYATYTTSTNAKFLRVRLVGAGGGGSSSGSASNNSGTAGTNTLFGFNLLVANGGSGGSQQGAGGNGGSASVSSPAIQLAAITGGGGQGVGFTGTGSAQIPGGVGGSSALGGNGGGGAGGLGGGNAAVNSGSGGGGAGIGAASAYSGSGGGAGGFADAIVPSPSATYAYVVGVHGSGGALGTGGAGGGNGADAQIIVEEYYQ